MPQPQRSLVELATILRMRRDWPSAARQRCEGTPAGNVPAEVGADDAGVGDHDDVAIDFDTDYADDGFRTAGSVVIDDLLLCRRMRALRLDPDELYCSEPRAFGMLRRLCATCPVPGRCARDLADEFADPAWQDWRNYCPNATTLSILSALRGCGLDDAEAPAGR